MTDRTFTAAPENEIAISVLAEHLRGLPVGGVLTYPAASTAIGENAQGRGRRLLARARSIVEREDGSRFGTVSGIGVKRLETADVIGIGMGYRRHIRRTSKRAFDRLSGLRLNDLTEDQRKRIDAERAAFGAISLMTTEKSVATIAKNTTETALPVAETLRLFGGADKIAGEAA